MKILIALLTLSFPLFASFQVEDPYLWLEEMESSQTLEWIHQQNTSSLAYLTQCPEREQIRTKLRTISDHKDYGLPIQKGNRLFYFMRKKGNELSDLVVQEPTGETRVLVSPNEYAPLDNFEPSDDGQFVAYAISNAGADEQIWKILNVDSGEILPDLIEGIKFTSPVWRQDNGGVYYVSHHESTIHFHELGAQEDELLFELKNEAT